MNSTPPLSAHLAAQSFPFTGTRIPESDYRFFDCCLNRACRRFDRARDSSLDLVAIAPAFISSFSPEFYLLRILRLLRVVRLARSKALEESFRRLHFAISSRSNELKISCIYTGIVLFLSSALMYMAMYMAEGKIQEEQFGSILRCLWWSAVTITTVGYGDTYPVTPMGRLIASAVALIGIAVVAIPFGIISSGFSDAMREEIVELPDRQVQDPGQITG